MHAVLENVTIFVTTAPVDKTQHMSCTWSSRVCVQNFATVRRGVQEEIGHRQNKQALNYLVDNDKYFIEKWATSTRWALLVSLVARHV